MDGLPQTFQGAPKGVGDDDRCVAAGRSAVAANGLVGRRAAPLRAGLRASDWNRLPAVVEPLLVLRVVPSLEYRAGGELVLRGFRPWLPECIVIKSYARQPAVGTHKGPLFPGYLLLLPSPAWFDAEEAPSVIEVLKHADEPVALKHCEVAQLCHLLEADGGALRIEANAKRRRFAKGDAVRIAGGAWEGWNGLFVSSAKDRVKILLDVFGRPTHTSLSEALVEPA